MQDGGADRSEMAAHARQLPEHVPERVALVLSEVTVVAMMMIIIAEVLLRKFFHYSLDIADELGGYMLVAFAFFSLSICQARNAFHQVEFLQARLSPRWRTLSTLMFDVISLVFVAILLWQLGRLVGISWRTGETSINSLLNTYLTPLWIPRLTMPIGAAALCYTLARKIVAGLRELADARAG
jgi:TRAP-type C4-dicarboxylate transport system permease small subunit